LGIGLELEPGSVVDGPAGARVLLGGGGVAFSPFLAYSGIKAMVRTSLPVEPERTRYRYTQVHYRGKNPGVMDIS